MISSWINDAVRAFGRQMGLNGFELNERGAAGVRFENGIALYLEYADGALMMSAGVPVDADPDTMRRLLVSSHPSAARTVRLRTGYLSKSGEAIFTLRLAEREVTVSSLESAFRVLWAAADRLRRAAS